MPCCKNGHITTGSFCKVCNEKPQKAKKKTIKKVSEKRQKQNKEYSIERSNFLALRPCCEVCGGESTEIHHKKGRENEILNDVEYWMAVCRGCHNLIHSNPTYSYEMGYLIKRTTKL